VAPTHKTRDKENMATLRTTSPRQHKKGNENSKKDTRKWCEYHKIPWHNTEECHSKKSLVVELKASESEEDSDSESNPEGGKWIIDVEPSAIVTTTKVQPSEPKMTPHSHPYTIGWLRQGRDIFASTNNVIFPMKSITSKLRYC
jgi:hypothetical protein